MIENYEWQSPKVLPKEKGYYLITSFNQTKKVNQVYPVWFDGIRFYMLSIWNYSVKKMTVDVICWRELPKPFTI